MDRQLGSLRRQAKKAEQYRTLQDEFKALDLALICRSYRALSEELTALDGRREELLLQEEQVTQETQRLQAERTEVTEALDREEAALHEWEERRHVHEGALRQGEQKKQFLGQQEQRASARETTAEEEITGLVEKRRSVKEEV